MTVKIFNDQNDPQGQIQPTQTAVLKNFVKSFSQQLRVCLPGTIVDYDYKLQKATVQPSFSNEYNDGTISPLPQIFDVPVIWPSSGGAFIHFPLAKGDRVTLIFSDKALDLWLSSGATSQPDDNRTHHIADAMAIPGGRPFNQPMEVSNGTDAIMGFKNLQLRLKPNGHVQFFTGLNTAGSQELVQILVDMLQAIIDARVPTAIGPQPLVNPQLTLVLERLTTFLEA